MKEMRDLKNSKIPGPILAPSNGAFFDQIHTPWPKPPPSRPNSQSVSITKIKEKLIQRSIFMKNCI